jgi:hypothetical protein
MIPGKICERDKGLKVHLPGNASNQGGLDVKQKILIELGRVEVSF